MLNILGFLNIEKQTPRKTRGVWSLKKFLKARFGKIGFSMRSKTNKAGEKAGGGVALLINVVSSPKPEKTLQNPSSSGENLTGGTLEAAQTSSACSTLWLWCSGIFLQQQTAQVVWTKHGTSVHCFQDISTWRPSGGSFSVEDIFPSLSPMVWNGFCSSFAVNLAQWWERPAAARLAGEESRCWAPGLILLAVASGSQLLSPGLVIGLG